MISRLTDEDIAQSQQNFAKLNSVGQRRMAARRGGRRDKLAISPNLWAGVGLVRGGAGTALVGDARTVAERLQKYVDAGANGFVLSGYPNLEEAYRFAELGVPAVARQGPRDERSAADGRRIRHSRGAACAMSFSGAFIVPFTARAAVPARRRIVRIRAVFGLIGTACLL